MSKRKERKIKNLKRKIIWPRIVGLIIADTMVLCCTGFLTYLAALGIVDSHILKTNSDCEKIVKVINENWNETDTSALSTKIKSLTDAYDTIKDVYILNSDFDVISTFGTPFPELKDEFFSIEKTRELVESNEIGRSHLNENLRDEFIENPNVEMDRIAKTFFKSLNFIRFSRNLDYLHWSDDLIDVQSQLAVYKTNIPGTYACFRTVYFINNFQAYFFGFLVIIFIIVFLLCLIFQIVKLCSFIANSTKIDLLISTDMTTGGKNKNWFIDKGKKLIKSNKRHYAVVQIRMEKYRNYCTSYGVKMGENLLEKLNNTLEKTLQKKEITAHIEKADFALLLNYENEEQLNQRILSIISDLSNVRKNQHLTFISGVAEVNSKPADLSSLLSASSLALSKVTSSNNIIWFNDSMKEEQVWERRIEDDMEIALENHEFKLYLQPKYSTKGEKLSAAEALVRWIHPVLGFISPGKFIPIFENNGFILKLDDYMLTEVAKQQAKWMEEGKQLVPISVNVSRAHFTKDDLAEHICQIVDEFKVPHQFIELELTESAFFDDKNTLLNTVKKLKSFGFAVSMDDFGAGYSSLNSLKELPLDVIKLDAEFFRGVDDINRANLIVGDTISLAKKLGMSIVAEGIETREQVDFLAQQDCDLIQGFYFAKPLPVNEFEERAYPIENKVE